MVNKSLVGQFGPEYTVPIERGKIRELAIASYAGTTVHVDDPRAPIPATYLGSAGVLWGYTLERPRGTLLKDLNCDLSVPLHAEEAYVFHGPLPRAGDTLTARACLESAVTKKGSRGGELTFLVLLTEFRDPAGRLRVEARSTTVTTSASPTDDSWSNDVPLYEPDYQDHESFDPFGHIQPASRDALVLGGGPGPVSTGALTLFEMVRFQAAGGEMNPLHYDAAHAKAEGFPSLFGLGMHQASALASYASRWLGAENVRAFRARFPNVYWVGDRLTYDGQVTNLYENAGQELIDLSLTCTRDADKEPVAQVWMTYQAESH